ncbi:hypothetical protein [Xanthobacter agilis]|uniref:Uncharacterized protein n=1 Tax=Xanthobacter agilis TaxID=47492 RepID=A0ABU0LJX0_XANAG|nr:hypothetical protein [Xanthobacter agilis]MDQ0507439.1 hypothetical protein [Xanthobacter agilis]
MMRTYVRIDWERGADGAFSPYLSIARHDQPVERIPLTCQDVARLVADGAYLWSVVEGSMQNLHNAGQNHFVGSNKMVRGDWSADHSPPHFIGAWGE